MTRIKTLLPDAVYTTWKRIRPALKRAIAKPPTHPTKPASLLAGYAGAALPKKLGIRAGSVVALIDAPAGFEERLGQLPDAVTVRRRPARHADLTIWFAMSRKDLERRIHLMAPNAEKGGLWIAWPKKASARAGDLSQRVVREVGLAAGLVDFKVCSIDATWTGLRFSKRRSARASL